MLCLQKKKKAGCAEFRTMLYQRASTCLRCHAYLKVKVVPSIPKQFDSSIGRYRDVQTSWHDLYFREFIHEWHLDDLLVHENLLHWPEANGDRSTVQRQLNSFSAGNTIHRATPVVEDNFELTISRRVSARLRESVGTRAIKLISALVKGDVLCSTNNTAGTWKETWVFWKSFNKKLVLLNKKKKNLRGECRAKG